MRPTIPALPPVCDAFYEAVEIGTSNFDTFIQRANARATGLSADAMLMYINQLPNMTCWRKEATAVVGKLEEGSIGGAQTFFIDPHDIEKFHLPWWLKGCNSVNRPHPTAHNELKKRNLLHLLQNASVPLVSVEQFLEKYGVCRIGTFKVDVEGFDGDLLVAFSEWVKKKKACYADEVMGEFNELSAGRTSLEMADLALSSVGYKKEKKRVGWDQKWVYQTTIKEQASQRGGGKIKTV